MLAAYIQKTRKFIEEDLWKIKITKFSSVKAFAYRQLRIWVITITEFNKDKCVEKASALTYFSVLSVAPVLALAFGIAKAFNVRSYLEQELKTYLSGQEEVLRYASEAADRLLSPSNEGIITGISAIFLIYTVGRLMNNIETAFNGIWNTKKGRTIKRKVTDYLAVILLGPLVLIMSSSVSVFITTSIDSLAETITVIGFIKPLVRFIPYTLIWFLLFLLYLVFPNTSVKLKPALIAGIVAGTLFQLTQYAWIEGQVYMNRYNTVYATIAALPLFLIWMQLSWTILLFGAEFAFASQNVGTWAYDNEKLTMNLRSKRKLTLLVLRKVVRHFYDEDDAISFEMVCEELDIPRRFIREIVEDLLQVKLIRRISMESEDEFLQPGMDIHKMDVYAVYQRLDQLGMDSLPQTHLNEGFETIEQLMEDVDRTIKEAHSNKKILDL